MKIETLDDWNGVLTGCGCCPMPVCPVPTTECQSLDGFGQVGHAVYHIPTQTYYRTIRTDYADGGFYQVESPSAHWTELGGVWIEPVDLQYTDGDPKTGTATETKSNPVDIDASRSASIAAMESGANWATMTKGDSCSSTREDLIPFGFNPAYHVYAVFSRYRWIIPDTWPGSYFKLTWDLVFFPEGYDPEDPGSPQPSPVESNTWTWPGPGDPEDEDSWKSGWYENPIPSEPGENRVVNLRFECYKSAKFGVKPQVAGEAVDLPES